MESHLPKLREQARSLPKTHGVYFWQDGRDRILYVGKAVNLRSRVTSYFYTAQKDRRARELISCARSIRYEVTKSELESLLLESAMIKKEQPPFNRALRAPRRVYYLKLDAKLADPHLEVAQRVEDDESLYFGPFHSATLVRETVAYLHDVLPLRKCTARHPRCAPCLYHHMETCAAPLLDEAHRRRHQEAIAQLHNLLDGRSDRVMHWLQRKRDRLSETLLFEDAAQIQARLDALHQLSSRQIVLEAALRSRHVLVADEGTRGESARLLLVAKGSVISVREMTGDADGVVAWIRAHEPLARAVKQDQSELDAASVLERWVRCNRERVHWVAVPPGLNEEDLRERVASVLPLPVPV